MTTTDDSNASITPLMRSALADIDSQHKKHTKATLEEANGEIVRLREALMDIHSLPYWGNGESAGFDVGGEEVAIIHDICNKAVYHRPSPYVSELQKVREGNSGERSKRRRKRD